MADFSPVLWKTPQHKRDEDSHASLLDVASKDTWRVGDYVGLQSRVSQLGSRTPQHTHQISWQNKAGRDS